MSDNTGGPAFPQRTDSTLSYSGITTRDYFAAKATEEDINAHREGPMEEHIVSDANGRKHITHRSTRYTREQAKYRYADAMLKARAS